MRSGATASTILIDANLLVLLVVGSVRLDLVGKHKRTKGYGVGDYRLLLELLGPGPLLLLLPNVVTETSNLVADYREPDRTKLMRRLKELVDAFPEEPVASRRACAVPEFLRLGITDAALLALSQKSHVIYTDDLDLYLAAERRNVVCLYFTHEREARGIV